MENLTVKRIDQYNAGLLKQENQENQDDINWGEIANKVDTTPPGGFGKKLLENMI